MTTKKGILEFDLTDAESERDFIRAAKAGAYQNALWQIANEVFRPARKHGYDDKDLQALMTEDTVDAIKRLESMFFKILEENEVTPG